MIPEENTTPGMDLQGRHARMSAYIYSAFSFDFNSTKAKNHICGSNSKSYFNATLCGKNSLLPICEEKLKEIVPNSINENLRIQSIRIRLALPQDPIRVPMMIERVRSMPVSALALARTRLVFCACRRVLNIFRHLGTAGKGFSLALRFLGPIYPDRPRERSI